MYAKRPSSAFVSLLSLMLLGTLLIASPVRAADWPTYMHDNNRAGQSSEILPSELHLQWTKHSVKPPKRAWEGPRDAPIEGQSMKHRVSFDDAQHVAVVGDRVYFGSVADHQMRCVNAANGETLWSYFTEGAIRLAPTVWNNRVYFGSDDGNVYCLSADQGELVWKLRVGPEDERLLARGSLISRWPVRTGVLIDDGTAYFGAGIFPHEKVFLAAADATSGKLIWRNDHISQRDAGRDDLSPQGYLLINDEFLFVPSGRTMPAAFNRTTGEYEYKRSFSWRTSGAGLVGGAKAVLSDNGQLFSFGAQHMLALDQKSGSAGHAYITGRQMTFRGKIAYIANGKGIIAVDREAHAKASVERQKLFVKKRSLRGKTKELAAITKKMAELDTVGIIWKAEFNGESSLIRCGNLVIAGGEGEARAYNIETGEQVWSAKVDGEVRGLAVANGHIYVSTTNGTLYAFGGTKQDKPQEHAAVAASDSYGKDDLSGLYESAAEQILANTDVTQGFGLVLGAEEGRLAYELAKRSKLMIYAVESDEKKIAAGRRKLDAAGLYGHRVTFVKSEAADTPLSNYFANLVVSEQFLLSGKMPVSASSLGRYVKPCGGKVCIGQPKEGDAAAVVKELQSTYLREDAEISKHDGWAVLTRGKLPGAGDWSHQYGNVGNTSMSKDFRVKGSLGVLWYGDPGPSKTINRHEAASAPLSTNGRFFVQGLDDIRAYDAYNGLFLWEYKNPGAIRTGVFNNQETSNVAASDDSLFVAAGQTCTQLDAASGKIIHAHRAPQADDGVPRDWGYLAQHDGMLYGTSTIHSELASQLRRRGRTVGSATDAIFAVDLKTNKQKWTYRSPNIMHVTIAIGEGRMYFVESTISQEEREVMLRADKTELKKLTGEAAKKKEAELKKIDARRAVCLDAKTGEKLWSSVIDVTNVSGVSAGGGNICLMHDDGHVIIGGANANGHYWRQFLSGEFSKRRILVLDSKKGEKLWSRDANHMNRPVVVDGYVIAEPWSFELHTGEERKRVHPLTGEQTAWQFSRPGHHCGIITATPNMMLFRSGFIGYYDLYSDSGTNHFAGQRLGCWVNAIPGNGLVVIPEASAGCVCLFSITSTVVLEPREDRDPAWGIYSAAGPMTPVKRMALNLGAPGDRRDQFRNLWLSYPRPASRGRMEFVFDIKPKLASGGGYYAENADSAKVKADTPWVLSSGARGLSKCEIPLLGKNDAEAKYNIRLHFAELDSAKPGERVFDVKLQGNVEASGLDVAKEAGDKTGLVREFKDISVTDNLVVELVSKSKKPAIISGIEIQVVE